MNVPHLPHSVEAEESIVGGILVHGKAIGSVAEYLRAEHFHHPVLAAIFAAMLSLEDASRPIDALTVADEMRKQETFDRLRSCRGTEYFGELMGKVITVENLGFHARLVYGKSLARRVVSVATEIAARGCGEYGEIDDFIDGAERDFFAATQSAVRVTYEHAKGILNRTVGAIETRYEQKKAVTGVPSGFGKIDEITAGFQPGDLVIIAARPSMGKTALSMNAVASAAIEHGIPALVFSLEMSKEAVMERMLCGRARVDSARMRSGQLTTLDFVNIAKAGSAIASAPIYIDDSGAPSMPEIRSKCRRWRSDASLFAKPDQLGIIVVDYLQLIQGRSNKEDSRQREVSEISRGLKTLAKELKCPVVALSQLNRSLEARADKRPMLSDLRETGALEQDADVIMFIYRDEVYSKDECAEEDKGIAEIIIGKQRNGATGVTRLAWLSQFTQFENLADGHHQAPARPAAVEPSHERSYP